MLTGTELSPNDEISKRCTAVPTVTPHETSRQAYTPEHGRVSLSSFEAVLEPIEERSVNGVILLVVCGLFGFCAAVLAVIMRIEPLTAIIVYLGVSTGGCAVLITLLLSRNASSRYEDTTVLSAPLIGEEVTEATHTIFRQSQRMRRRYWMMFGVVILSVLITDHLAVRIGVVVCGFVVLLLSARRRKHVTSKRDSLRRS